MSHEHECSHYLPELSDYLDGELSPELCAELERHMAECEKCRIVVDTTRKTIELYQSSSDSQKTPSDVKERLYKRLDLEGFLIQPDKPEANDR
ncbi:MAG: zf-HC2 domain-containing protein [Anaerolineaceae bacterium]|nr:zf-HC2 domain-containing protein [Anaerolineaceae bacterium]MBN2676832.1 zf-HC2 domain-containing protein [Anaerolineaceae bacterium]